LQTNAEQPDPNVLQKNQRRAARSKCATEEDRNRVRQLNADFQRKAIQDKRKYLDQICKEMEEDNHRGRSRQCFEKVKQITRGFSTRFNTLRSNNGKTLTEDKRFLNNGKSIIVITLSERESITDLSERESITDSYEPMEYEDERAIKKEKVEAALKSFKKNKSPGFDDTIAVNLSKPQVKQALNL